MLAVAFLNPFPRDSELFQCTLWCIRERGDVGQLEEMRQPIPILIEVEVHGKPIKLVLHRSLPPLIASEIA